MPGDYSWCRARAWIEALINARAYIPKSATRQLRALRLDSSLGALALCALACPLYLVTPESSTDTEIRVYLNKPDDQAFERALENPERLAREMYLISDLTKRTNYLARHWPRSLAEARKRGKNLDERFAGLDALWNILHPSPEESLKRLSDEELNDIAELLGDSAILWLWVAERRERADLPHAALQAADKAVKYGAAPAAPAVWLSAEIYYARALAHWEMSQPALAETDLEAGAALLEKEGIKAPILARVYAKLGEFYSARDNRAEMCEAYEKACAAGECGKLAAARRDGKCGGESKTGGAEL